MIYFDIIDLHLIDLFIHWGWLGVIYAAVINDYSYND